VATVVNDEFNLVQVPAAPTMSREAEGISVVPVIGHRTRRIGGRNMSLIQPISTLRTLSFAIGVMLGLVSAVYAEPGTGQLPAHRPGSKLALDHGPTVARTWRQPTAAEINQRLAERGAAPSAPQLNGEDREVQQLYDEIMRQTDPSLRP
jgi:hypothetical protein